MTALLWDKTGEKIYEIGLDRGVYYPQSGDGVAWNGLVSVKDSVSGGDVSSYYIDGVKHLDVVASEDFQGTLTAYSAPKEFIESNGVRVVRPGMFAFGQPRNSFGFSYRTLIGNDTGGTDYAYKLHIIYNATASPVEKTYETLGSQNSAPTFDWTFDTVPVYGTGFKPTAHFEIDSDKISPPILAAIENILYGTSIVNPRLPTIDEILTVFDVSLISEPLSEPI